MLLSEARKAIEAALIRLKRAPPEHRCFVIVNDTVTNRFVQFCTMPRTHELALDLPYASLTPERDTRARAIFTKAECKEQSFLRVFRDPAFAPYLAMRILREVLDLPEFAELEIKEETSTPHDRRN